MKELVIDRSKWQVKEEHAEADGGGCLIGPLTKRMCCLGFAANDEGFSKKDLHGKSMPYELPEAKLPKYLQDYDFCDKAASINDDAGITIPVKEKKLKVLFAKKDIKLKFIGRVDG